MHGLRYVDALATAPKTIVRAAVIEQDELALSMSPVGGGSPRSNRRSAGPTKWRPEWRSTAGSFWPIRLVTLLKPN